ncbi:MAG: TolC family protein [Deltaproteobacteria bacterium]|nr:TolC family protein [Deltaproteobacteria bacterium]
MQKKVVLLLGFLIILILGTTSRSQDSYDGGKSLPYTSPSGPLSGSTEYIDIQEPTGPITLRHALQLALMRNPDLAAYSWEVRAKEAGKLQAKLLPNPEIEFEVEEFGGTGDLTGYDSAATTVQLSQLVLLGGKRGKATRVAKHEWELAGWDYESKRLDVLTETTKRFIEVLDAQSRLKLGEDYFDLAQEVFTVVSDKVQAGKVSPVEQSKAQVVLSSSEIELDQAKRNLRAARQDLAAMWGSTIATFTGARGDLAEIEEPPPLDQLLKWIEENPDLARWQTEIELNRAALDSAKADAIPDLTLFAGVQTFNETDDSAYVAGLSVPVPLFNRNQGGIKAAQHHLSRSEQERIAAEIRVKTALTRAYQNLSASYQASVTLKNQVLPSSRLAFDSTKEGYRLGKFGYLDVLDAQRTLFETEARYLSALADYHRSRAEVERLIGMELGAVDYPTVREEEANDEK